MKGTKNLGVPWSNPKLTTQQLGKDSYVKCDHSPNFRGENLKENETTTQLPLRPFGSEPLFLLGTEICDMRSFANCRRFSLERLRLVWMVNFLINLQNTFLSQKQHKTQQNMYLYIYYIYVYITYIYIYVCIYM